MFAPYELKIFSDERAIRILEELLAELSLMEPEEMTTFELGILHRCAVNPPSQTRGAEVSS